MIRQRKESRPLKFPLFLPFQGLFEKSFKKSQKKDKKGIDRSGESMYNKSCSERTKTK